MSINLKGRDFLTLLDFTPEEIQYLLDFSAELKAEKKDGKPHKTHEGKNIALIFEKSSTRTRCPLRWRPAISEWEVRIWPADPRLV